VCAALAPAGVSRIVLVNWHEGNSPTLRLAAAEAQQRHGLRILIAETHVITHTLYPDEMEFTHAGAMETAAVLAYEPGLVHLDRAVESSALASGESAHELFRQRDVYPVLHDFHDIAPTGWYGRPERAEAGRAEEIAESVADHVVRRVKEIWTQLADHDGPVPDAGDGDGLSVAAAGARR
jgi:creatinine amidohydrolase